jgi:hypothetical protein
MSYPVLILVVTKGSKMTEITVTFNGVAHDLNCSAVYPCQACKEKYRI